MLPCRIGRESEYKAARSPKDPLLFFLPFCSMTKITLADSTFKIHHTPSTMSVHKINFGAVLRCEHVPVVDHVFFTTPDDDPESLTSVLTNESGYREVVQAISDRVSLLIEEMSKSEELGDPSEDQYWVRVRSIINDQLANADLPLVGAHEAVEVGSLEAAIHPPESVYNALWQSYQLRNRTNDTEYPSVDIGIFLPLPDDEQSKIEVVVLPETWTRLEAEGLTSTDKGAIEDSLNALVKVTTGSLNSMVDGLDLTDADDVHSIARIFVNSAFDDDDDAGSEEGSKPPPCARYSVGQIHPATADDILLYAPSSPESDAQGLDDYNSRGDDDGGANPRTSKASSPGSSMDIVLPSIETDAT